MNPTTPVVIPPSPAAEPGAGVSAPAGAKPVAWYPLVDLVRLLFAFGIILTHEKLLNDQMMLGVPVRSVGYVGLFGFILFAGYLSGLSSKPLTREAIGQRAKRLLMPWAVWWLIYAALFFARDVMKDGNEFVPHTIKFWVAGPSVHLWFLPFALVASILTKYCVDLTGRGNRLAFASVGIALGLLLCYAVDQFVPLLPAWTLPLEQWSIAVPGLCFAFAMIHLQKSPIKSSAARVLAWLVPIALVWGLFLLTRGPHAWLYAVALTLSALALCIKLDRRVNWVVALGATAMGVYLLSPAVTAVLRQAPGIAWAGLAISLVTFVISLLLTVGLTRTRLAWLVK